MIYTKVVLLYNGLPLQVVLNGRASHRPSTAYNGLGLHLAARVVGTQTNQLAHYRRKTPYPECVLVSETHFCQDILGESLDSFLH